MIRGAMIALLFVGSACSVVVQAQDAYPSRAVSMVVPFPPGGMADLAGRPLAHAMEKTLKQPVALLNKPGASGAVGMQTVAIAKPDGYTIMNTLVSFQTIPEVDGLFSRKPAYTRDQFAPIALIAADPPMLVVGADTPWKHVRDLIADAKKRPAEIIYSSSGLYGPSHVPMEMFLHEAGIRMRHLPVVGGSPAMTAVLGGNATMWASPPAMAVPHAAAGKLRLLAGWGAARHPAFPDVPTFKELGFNLEFYVWAGVFVPAATPASIQKILRDAVKQAVEDTDFKTAMNKIQTPVAYKDAPEFQKFLDAEHKVLAEAIKRIGKVEEKK